MVQAGFFFLRILWCTVLYEPELQLISKFTWKLVLILRNTVPAFLARDGAAAIYFEIPMRDQIHFLSLREVTGKNVATI